MTAPRSLWPVRIVDVDGAELHLGDATEPDAPEIVAWLRTVAPSGGVYLAAADLRRLRDGCDAKLAMLATADGAQP